MLVYQLIIKVEELELTINKTQNTNNSVKSSDKWLTLEELREYLPEHPAKATIYGWVSSRTIPHHKGNKRLRFKQSEIDSWIADGKRKSESELTQQATEYLSKRKGGLRYE